LRPDANLAGTNVSRPESLSGEQRPGGSEADQPGAPTCRSNPTCEGKTDIDWFAPIIADAEAGFGGPLNVFELTKAMIEAGAAGVHFEDQLASEKKCGHMGGKVLLPTQQAITHLIAARLAADVSNVPTIIVARTDANAAALLTNDVDERDHEFLTGERTAEGFYRVRAGPGSGDCAWDQLCRLRRHGLV
jgi:isocitrate lyase